MYTGIIHYQAVVKTIEKQENGNVFLTFSATPQAHKRLKVDDSVSVEGVCLTIIKIDPHSFSVEVMPETLRLTTLESFQKGESVNLELSLRAQDAIDGHFVMGHVDGTGTVTKLQKDRGSLRVTIKTPKELMRFMSKKGSIAVNGVSLTITEIASTVFKVALIPHTLKKTTLGRIQEGSQVNLEVDTIARSVVRFLDTRSKNK